MATSRPSFSLGIEEEYFLVDRDTRDVVAEPPASILAECRSLLHHHVVAEFLESQIEVSTGVCANVAAARADLAHLRETVSRVAGAHGLAVVAASTHPFADWGAQRHTRLDWSDALARDMQRVARRLLVCAMHVHVGIEDEDLRIILMNQVSSFLPYLLALSTSSPFWRGEDTGLMSYRLSVVDDLPRAGLPEIFADWEEYQRHMAVLIRAGLIDGPSRLWWDIRPSALFPTLELRITDVCSRLDDAITVAALFRSLLAMLYRRHLEGRPWPSHKRMLLSENRWRAERYGLNEGFLDCDSGEILKFDALLGRVIDELLQDAEELGCLAEVQRAAEILQRGTSAHHQLQTHQAALNDGATSEEALRAVVDFLIEETYSDL
jgi:carboxylate-amine ligase